MATDTFRFVWLCFALIAFALLCSALICFALLCSALHCPYSWFDRFRLFLLVETIDAIGEHTEEECFAFCLFWFYQRMQLRACVCDGTAGIHT